MLYKILPILLIFFGEVLSIIAELFASKQVAAGEGYLRAFFWMFLVITFAGALLVAGYMTGYLYLKNIWIVAAVSIGCIAVAEPILAYLVFGQLPTFGPALGMGLGLLGILAALLIP